MDRKTKYNYNVLFPIYYNIMNILKQYYIDNISQIISK